jgi:hypothetical protein
LVDVWSMSDPMAAQILPLNTFMSYMPSCVCGERRVEREGRGRRRERRCMRVIAHPLLRMHSLVSGPRERERQKEYHRSRMAIDHGHITRVSSSQEILESSLCPSRSPLLAL